MDTLRPSLVGARVLDLYAGQGRLGFCAAEEGAAAVTFVEAHGGTLSELKENAKHPLLKDTVFSFHKMAALPFLETKIQEPFDIVFCDPPFQDWKNTFAEELFTHLTKALKAGSILLVKHPSRMVLSCPVQHLQSWKSTVFGEAALSYFLYGKDSKAPNQSSEESSPNA